MINIKEKVSLLSVAVNVFLAISKIVVGFLSRSTALLADGIHSGLDILSSAATYLGVKIAQRTSDDKHPYGHGAAETVAGFLVSLFLAISAIWIAWEGIGQILHPAKVDLGVWGYIVVGLSVIINEAIARYKFKVGSEEKSLALIADAQHSRADAISSVGVLIGLVFVKFWPAADGVLALLIGTYVLYESWDMGREATDQLIGINDEEAEEKIKEILAQQNIELSSLKTRRIGAESFAELTIKLDPHLKVEEAEAISKDLQNKLISQVPSLSYVVVQVESHKYSQGVIRPRIGRHWQWRRGFDLSTIQIRPKFGWRIMIPFENGQIPADEFGAPQYLVVDKQEDGSLRAQIVKNPFYEPGAGYGMRAVRLIKPDEIITKHIGENARRAAQADGIKIKLIDKEAQIKDIFPSLEMEKIK